MQRCADDRRLTESVRRQPSCLTLPNSAQVDLLMPNVGEIIGGSMRIWDSEELLEGYKREGIDPSPYYWYTDQVACRRRVRASPRAAQVWHVPARRLRPGARALPVLDAEPVRGRGVMRSALTRRSFHIREVCLYPRTMDRCKP